MNAISTREMTREEWLETRHHLLTGTSARRIFAPTEEYGSMLDEYYEKTQPFTPPPPPNQFMKRGIAFEQYAAEQWADENGRKVVRDLKIRLHPEKDANGEPFIGGNIDRVIYANNGEGPGIMEVKTHSRRVFDSWDGEIPAQHFFQIMHYFLITGYTWGVLAVLTIEDWQLHSIPIEPDKELLGDMLWKLTKFQNENIIPRIPPDPQTVKDVCRLYPKHQKEKFVEVDRQMADIAAMYKLFREQEKQGAEGKEECRQRLVTSIGDAEGLTHDGRVLCTFKASKPHSVFQIDELQRIDPELYLQYVVDIPTFNEEAFRTENPDAYKVYCKDIPGQRTIRVK
jgi:predicted phage-related endonuclease